jgi:hypothetical protein
MTSQPSSPSSPGTASSPGSAGSASTEATQPYVRPIPYVARGAAWPTYAPSEIVPGLWQGGTEDDEVVGGRVPADHAGALVGRRPRFDVVVTLYADAQPAPWGVEELRFGFPDADLTPDFARRAVALARHAHRRWRDGERVLVRCQAGVNRSGLVMALVLMLEGHDVHDAIALIRARRAPAVLSNFAYVRWLVQDAAGALGRTEGGAVGGGAPLAA